MEFGIGLFYSVRFGISIYFSGIWDPLLSLYGIWDSELGFIYFMRFEIEVIYSVESGINMWYNPPIYTSTCNWMWLYDDGGHHVSLPTLRSIFGYPYKYHNTTTYEIIVHIHDVNKMIINNLCKTIESWHLLYFCRVRGAMNKRNWGQPKWLWSSL
jgi:hypothetical protein